jgi:hypothetical protein
MSWAYGSKATGLVVLGTRARGGSPSIELPGGQHIQDPKMPWGALLQENKKALFDREHVKRLLSVSPRLDQGQAAWVKVVRQMIDGVMDDRLVRG